MPNYHQVLNSCMGVIIFVLLGLASTRSNNIKMIIVLAFFVAMILFLTLFSWCLLLLMMVMIALWMNKPSAKIPVRLGNDDLETDLIIVKL